MEWHIRADYDPGDETIHFGTRAYAESEGCIYEITTVATFENEEEVSAMSLPIIIFYAFLVLNFISDFLSDFFHAIV